MTKVSFEAHDQAGGSFGSPLDIPHRDDFSYVGYDDAGTMTITNVVRIGLQNVTIVRHLSDAFTFETAEERDDVGRRIENRLDATQLQQMIHQARDEAKDLPRERVGVGIADPEDIPKEISPREITPSVQTVALDIKQGDTQTVVRATKGNSTFEVNIRTSEDEQPHHEFPDDILNLELARFPIQTILSEKGRIQKITVPLSTPRFVEYNNTNFTDAVSSFLSISEKLDQPEYSSLQKKVKQKAHMREIGTKSTEYKSWRSSVIGRIMGIISEDEQYTSKMETLIMNLHYLGFFFYLFQTYDQIPTSIPTRDEIISCLYDFSKKLERLSSAFSIPTLEVNQDDAGYQWTLKTNNWDPFQAEMTTTEYGVGAITPNSHFQLEGYDFNITISDSEETPSFFIQIKSADKLIVETSMIIDPKTVQSILKDFTKPPASILYALQTSLQR